MNNYLGNLIARHLNQAEVLQPRLASRFEPQSSVFEMNADEVATSDAERSDFETRIDGPVSREPVQPSRSTETFLDLNVAQSAPLSHPTSVPSLPVESEPSIRVPDAPPPDAPERRVEPDEPAIVLTGERDKPIAQASSSAPSSERAEVFASEASVEEPEAGPVPVPSSLPTKTQRARTTNQVAETIATETVEERVIVESDAPRSTTKASVRTRPPRPSLSRTPPSSPIDSKPQVAVLAAGSTKEPAVPNSLSRPTLHTVARPELRRETEQVKSQHTEAPAIAEHELPLISPPEVSVAPATPIVPAIDSAENQTSIQVSPAQPKQTTPAPRPPLQTQRAPFFETREIRAAQNQQNQPRSVTQKFSEAEPAEAGPTVNVTIGRIEVRAATQIPEAQPQKQRREHQVLSLDEYLSQRSAGGR